MVYSNPSTSIHPLSKWEFSFPGEYAPRRCVKAVALEQSMKSTVRKSIDQSITLDYFLLIGIDWDRLTDEQSIITQKTLEK